MAFTSVATGQFYSLGLSPNGKLASLAVGYIYKSSVGYGTWFWSIILMIYLKFLGFLHLSVSILISVRDIKE